MRGGRPWFLALGRRIHDKRLVGDRPHLDRLFEETPEKEASELRTPPVEAESEFVKVALEVISLHRSLMGAE
jgi:hypothetical protein